MIFRHVPRITTIGKSIFDPIWSLDFHASVDTEVLHIVKGRAQLQTEDYTIPCREGDTLYIPKAKRHRDVFASGSYYETYVVHLDWEDEPDMLRVFKPEELVPTSPDTRREIRKGFEVMFRDFRKETHGSDDFIGVQMLWIISAMCRDAQNRHESEIIPQDEVGHSRRVMIMEEARRIILERFRLPITLDDIASELNISTYHLSRVFSRESGFTLSGYLTSVRMERAAELLAEPRLNITEIAREVGYQDSRYFSQVFKAHFGKSPKSYRDSIPVGSNRV